jgi:signal transduction histidine kinase
MISALPDETDPETDDSIAGEIARLRQRTITERLLLVALRAQDAARRATAAEGRAEFLVSAGRELAMILDEDAIRDIVRRSSLPRAGSWCIVDIVESNGTVLRLSALHPDPAKQALARSLEDRWDPAKRLEQVGATSTPDEPSQPCVITAQSGAALLAAAHGPSNLEILRQVGFSELLVIPLVVRDTVLGNITFVTREGDQPLTPEEISLGASLAERCAIALDNARLYAEAEELRAAADVANRAKSAFLGNITHELLTPLNAIGGYADLMEMGLHGPLTVEQRTDLERIKRSQRHLVALIKGILEFVHAERGNTEFHPAQVLLQPLLHETAEMLSPAAAAKQLAIEIKPGSENVLILADPIRVRQILVNLLTNAVKYSAAGAGAIELSSTVAPHFLRISVSDAGPGIPADQLAAIFDPFVQLASGMHSRQGGVGLGLSISRDLAIAMKGELSVRSTMGVGSEFTLTLPRAAEPLIPAQGL